MTATGTYDTDDTVIVRYRTREGASGIDVVVPLRDRRRARRCSSTAAGWPPTTGARTPATCRRRRPARSPSPAGCAPTRPATAPRSTDHSTRAISSAEIGEALDQEVYGGFVDLQSEDPPPAQPLAPAELPELDNGPHFFYGLQWWFFGVLAIFGFGYLAVRRVARPAGGATPRVVRGDAGRRGDSERAEHPAVDRQHDAGDERRRRREQEGRDPAELLRARRSAAAGSRSIAAARAASGSPSAASSSATRSVPIRPGSSPLTRMPRGPSSSARVLATIASPGRSPLEIAMSGSGARTLEESTRASEPPSPQRLARSRGRAGRRRGRPTRRRGSTGRRRSPVTGPLGGPPTLISAPSRRPQRSWAARDQAARGGRVGVVGDHRHGRVAERLRQPPRATPRERPETTTRAPSATRQSAVARPRPRAPPVTT